jgi:hypothetical protein
MSLIKVWEFMSDSIFRWSLTIFTGVTFVWILGCVAISILGLPSFDLVWEMLIALILLIIGGGTLLYFWGKSYMSRV